MQSLINPALLIESHIRQYLSREIRVGVHLPAVHDGHSAGRHRFRRLLNLYETHPVVDKNFDYYTFQGSEEKIMKLVLLVTAPAVSCNGEAVVVAKARDLHPSHGCGLQHCCARIHEYLSMGSCGIKTLSRKIYTYQACEFLFCKWKNIHFDLAAPFCHR